MPKFNERHLTHLKRSIPMKEMKSVTKDPICEMTVDEATALIAERDGEKYYFCSEDCRQKFKATPSEAKPEETPES
jgi:Cu+-exporting ATPase